VSLVAEADRLPTSTSGMPYPERVRLVALAQQSVQRAKDEIVRRAATGAEQRYAADLERLFTERRSEYMAAAGRSEDAADDAGRKLSNRQPRASVRAEHEALVAAFRERLITTRELHAAVQGADPDRAFAAASQLDSGGAEMRAAVERVVDRLGYWDRWPTPADS